MEVLILGVAIVFNTLVSIMELVEAARVRLYKHRHYKRKWNNGKWIIRE